MSALWNVQLLALENKKCTVNVKNVHSNDGYVPTEPVFVIQILHDGCLQGSYGDFHFPKGTLGNAITTTQSLNNNYLEKVVGQYIESIAVISEQNEQSITSKVIASLKSKDIAEDTDEWDEAYENEMEKYSIESIFEITMTDQKYLDHLFPIEHEGKMINRPNWDSFATL